MNLRETEDDFQKRTGQRAGNKGIPKGKNLPEIVNAIVFVRQLEAKVLDNYYPHLPLLPIIYSPLILMTLYQISIRRFIIIAIVYI